MHGHFIGLTADACIYFDHGLPVFPASAGDAWKHPTTGEKKRVQFDKFDQMVSRLSCCVKVQYKRWNH